MMTDSRIRPFTNDEQETIRTCEQLRDRIRQLQRSTGEHLTDADRGMLLEALHHATDALECLGQLGMHEHTCPRCNAIVGPDDCWCEDCSPERTSR
jgi:hypothetical protein